MMGKKNVLLLCHDYHAPFLSVAVQYASFFRDAPYNLITVFIKGAPSSFVEEQVFGEKVIFLNKETSDLKGFKTAIIKEVKELHQVYNFQFCLAHRYKSMYVSARVGIKTIGISHIDGVFRNWKRKLSAYLLKEKLSLVGVSKAIRDDMRKDLHFFSESKIDFLYNSLDFEDIRASQLDRKNAREFLDLPQDSFIFGNVGRLHKDKDQKTLINAFSLVKEKMPSAILVIIGDGRLMGDLEKQVNELGLQDRVKLLGKVPEAIKYFKAFDCFILSSIREGLPVAMLEAFAARIPPIASLCNGNEEAIEGLGVGFDIGDDKALAGLMLESYERDESDKGQILKKIDDKVQKYFTNEAVDKAFWELDFIKYYSEQDTK